MPPRAVLFDLFDTLVDLHMEYLPIVEVRGRKIPSTLTQLHAAAGTWSDLDFERFCAELHASDRELFADHFGKGLELPTLKRFAAFCRRVGIEHADAPQVLTDTHMGKLREQVRILPHHRDVLAELRERHPLGLVSNFSHSPLALRVLDEAGLEPFLDPVVVSDAALYRKPRPEIFHAALERLDLEPSDVIHVGDNLDADVRGAAELGIRTVWIRRRIADPAAALAAHEGPPPSAQIDDLAELPEVLEALS